ncbi:MAG: hypothetical protein MRZ79_16800 [Bacteroidia bacterium]|nr:hypothetical protein [Bacteroidia bacterium]
MRKLYFLSFIWVLAIACNPTQNQTADKEGSSSNSSKEGTQGVLQGPKVPIECNMHEYDYKAMANNSGVEGMFPYVYRGAGRSRIFEAYTIAFQLTHQPPLIPQTNYEIPWMNPDSYNEQNGNFITYIRNGYEKSLQNPYIMVQYIRKDVPHAGSADSLINWVDNFIDHQEGAVVLKDNYELKTVSGFTAKCKDYKYPKQDDREGKSLAYAYIDYNKDYIVGMVLTTVHETDFPLNKPLFEELVKSFCN